MLIRADARHIPLKDKTVQCVVTSPPYWGLRDYGLGENGIGLERTPENYVDTVVEVFREVRRVLKDDGVLWLNLGDCYHNGDKGGYAKDRIKAMDTMQRSNLGANFIGAPNRMPHPMLKPKDLIGIPWRVAFALQADGWYLRSDIIWSKPNPMPESVRDRPTKAHEYIFLLSKSERYFWDQEAVREPHARLWDEANGGSWSYGKGDAERVRERGKAGTHSGPYPLPNANGRNIRSVWEIATQPYSGSHFATFPEEIPKRCIQAASKPGDVVLDPFCGSGTTVIVARRLGRIGIGLDLKYQELAAERVAGPLFKDVVNSAW